MASKGISAYLSSHALEHEAVSRDVMPRVSTRLNTADIFFFSIIHIFI